MPEPSNLQMARIERKMKDLEVTHERLLRQSDELFALVVRVFGPRPPHLDLVPDGETVTERCGL